MEYEKQILIDELPNEREELREAENKKIKHKRRTLEERIELSKKRTAILKRKIASRERKEHTHLIFEIGTYFDNRLKPSSLEEAKKLIDKFKEENDLDEALKSLRKVLQK